MNSIEHSYASELFAELADPLMELIDDLSLTEIYVDAFDNISYMKNGLIHNSDIEFDSPGHFHMFCTHILNNEKANDDGLYSVNVTSGHRFSIKMPLNSTDIDECKMTIRLFRAIDLTYKDLIENKAFTQEQWDIMYKYVFDGKNVLIAGKPNSGKTTILRCLLNEVENKIHPRFLFVEDPRELNLDFKNGFIIEVNHRDPQSAERALRFCLRNSPRLMIVGEILDPSVARTYIESIEAGFSGTVSTIHADNAKVTTRRLATLATKNSNINKEDWLVTADETIDLVIYVSFNQTTGERKVTDIYNVKEKTSLI